MILWIVLLYLRPEQCLLQTLYTLPALLKATLLFLAELAVA